MQGHERSTRPTATYAQLAAMKKQKLEELKKAYRFIGKFREDSAEASFLFVNVNVCTDAWNLCIVCMKVLTHSFRIKLLPVTHVLVDTWMLTVNGSLHKV